MLLAVVSLFASLSAAQGVGSGTIQGKVTDESGASLPGVTVTLTGPALQVPQMVTTTETDGTYSFRDLRAGEYQVAYELSGFQRIVRAGLRLTVGFVAKVDATMKVNAIQESVTVSAASPVVDTTTTASSTNFTNEVLESVPRGRAIWDVLAMAPGVTAAAAPDVGDSGMSHRSNLSNYGGTGLPKLSIEGVNVQTLNDRSGAYYMDYANFDEVQVKAAGNDAEMANAGVNFLAVVKSGGNQFHGTYHAAYQNSGLQSSNIDAALEAQGLQDEAPLDHYYDISGDLGGRIIRDRLWFYGAATRQELSSGILGFASAPGPDGRYLTSDDVTADALTRLDNQTLKLSYQPATKYRIVGLYQRGLKYLPDGAQDGDRFTPLEATTNYRFVSTVWKGELQATPAKNLMVNFVSGYFGYNADYKAQAFADKAGNPSREDISTGLFTGPTTSASRRPVWRYQTEGSLSYFVPNGGGKHNLKAGFNTYSEGTGTSYLNKVSGNYLLMYDDGAPFQITTYNYPVDPTSKMSALGIYVKDSWTIGTRLSANLGVRYDRYHSFLPAQVKQQGAFGGAGSFDRQNVLTWNKVVPRVGIAWDVSGNAKTVVKATFGIFDAPMGAGFASAYNKNALSSATYLWDDPNGSGDFEPGEVDLDTNGPDFVSITGAANNLLNPDLHQPTTQEYSASLERELAPTIAVRGIYVYKTERDLYRQINVLRPLSAYTIPVPRTDPGPDGVLKTGDDGGVVTLYDYTSAYRGSAFVGNEYQNSPSPDRYQSIEGAITKRPSNGWNVAASFGTTKNHRWLTTPASTPADLSNPLDDTWSWFGRISGAYDLPKGVQVGVMLQSQSGAYGQRTYVFRRTDPSGPPLVQLSTVTMRLDTYGAQQARSVNTLNLRFSKEFKIRTTRLGAEINIYNLLNANPATAVTWASGPSYGYVTAILPPRIARFGVKFTF
jgi:outer membrane receptor protein involved in Fe transport